jgi:hypothetical protein
MNFFGIAAEHARQYRDRVLTSHDPQAAPCVVVELAIGWASFPRSVLDEFTPGTLTVTSLDSGTFVRVCPPGTWREAKQLDALGHVEMSCLAMTAVSKPCTHCSAQAWFVQRNGDGSVTYQCPQGHLVIVDAPADARRTA